MFKLLRADFYRALRYKVFWVLLAGNALLGFIAVLNAYSFYVNFGPQYNAFYAMQQGLGGGCGLLGILSAVIIGCASICPNSSFPAGCAPSSIFPFMR